MNPRFSALILLPLFFLTSPMLQGDNPKQSEAAALFPFAQGKVGDWLIKIVLPKLEQIGWEIQAKSPQPMDMVTPEDLPLNPISPAIIDLPQSPFRLKKTLPSLPGLVGDTLPVAGEPVPLPATPAIAVGDRFRIKSLATNQSLAMEPIGTPVGDRMTFEDPTLEEGLMPVKPFLIEQRTEAIQIGRQSIPDPFENHGPVQLPKSLPELTNLPIIPVRLPAR